MVWWVFRKVKYCFPKVRQYLLIAKGQFEKENELVGNGELLFCDTDFCVTYIWCMVKYGKCDDWIVDRLKENQYDLYLLCDIDLPWEYDPLREHPDKRTELFEMYRNLMDELGFNYRIVRGTDSKRLLNAVSFVEECLQEVSASR